MELAHPVIVEFYNALFHKHKKIILGVVYVISLLLKRRLITADYKNNYKEEIVPIWIIIPGIKPSKKTLASSYKRKTSIHNAVGKDEGGRISRFQKPGCSKWTLAMASICEWELLVCTPRHNLCLFSCSYQKQVYPLCFSLFSVY